MGAHPSRAYALADFTPIATSNPKPSKRSAETAVRAALCRGNFVRFCDENHMMQSSQVHY
jgi:hypothetical protein